MNTSGLRRWVAGAFDAPAVGAPAVFLRCLLLMLGAGACYGAAYEAANSLLEFGDRLLLTRLPLLMRLLGQSLLWGLMFGAVAGTVLGVAQGAALAAVTTSSPRWRRPAMLRWADRTVVGLALAMGGYGLLAQAWAPLRTTFWPAAMLPLPLALVGAAGCLAVVGALPRSWAWAHSGTLRVVAGACGVAACALVRLWMLVRTGPFDLRLFGG